MPSIPGKCYIFGERNFFEAFPTSMQTELLNPPALGTPWLEHLSPESNLPAQIPVDKYPFTIGRNESVDLRIDSSRVSREHAQILRRKPAAISVKDLQSTNGTFVNGNRIQESPLCDGDMLMVANEEFTFYAGPVDRAKRMVTQVIELRRPRIVEQAGSSPAGDSCRAAAPGDALARQPEHDLANDLPALRRAALRLRSPRLGRDRNGRIFGSGTIGAGHRLPADRRDPLFIADDRRRRSRRSCRATGPLFIRFDTKDLGAGGMTESIAQLRELLAPERRLILALPYNAACNLPFAQELHRQLRAKEVGLAYYDFADLHEKALQQMEIVPDFLLLAKSVMRGLSNNFERQRQMQAIIASVRKLGGEIIALGLNTPVASGTLPGIRLPFRPRNFPCQHKSVKPPN